MIKQEPLQAERFIEIFQEEAKHLSDFFYDLPQKSSDLGELDNINSANHWVDVKNEIRRHKSPRTLSQLADVHLIRGSLDNAKKYYQKVIDSDKTFISAYEKIILISFKQKKFEEVDFYYNELLMATNRRTDILHEYVLFKLFYFKNDSGVVDESLSEILSILEDEKDNFIVYNTCGFIFLNFKDDPKEAIKYFKKSIDINPLYAYSLNNVGVCLTKDNKLKEAEKYFRSAIKCDDIFGGAYANLAGVFLKKDNPSKAIEILENASLIDVELPKEWQHKMGGLLIELNRIKRAIKWYEDRVIVEPKNNILYNNLGYCYLIKGDISESKRFFSKSVRLFNEKISVGASLIKGDFLAFYNTGRIYLEERKMESVKKIFKKIRLHNSEDAFAEYLEGAVFLYEKKYKKAKKCFEKSFKKDAGIPDIYPSLSFIYESIEKDYKAAISCLKISISKGFDNDLVLNNLSYAYIKNGDLKEAEKILDLYKNDFSPILFTNKGLLSFKKGDIKKGDIYYEKAISGLPGHLKELARQHWYYEKAQVLAESGKNEDAKRFVDMANALPESYLTLEIVEFSETLE